MEVGSFLEVTGMKRTSETLVLSSFTICVMDRPTNQQMGGHDLL